MNHEPISVSEARAIVLQHAAIQPREDVPLKDALHRTLAVPVYSRDNLPPFDNSAMDGFAVRAGDLSSAPAQLRIIEEIPAGTMPQRAIEAGTCARIMTGAPVPAGADAVVPVEWCRPGDDAEHQVLILQAPEVGQHIRRAAEDIRAGDQIFSAGQQITPPVIGMLAALGYPVVSVFRRAVVAVVATGDELVGGDAELKPGQIRNSNGPALAAQVSAAGGIALPPMMAVDDEHDIEACLDEALAADIVVISGGVSVGAHDLVRKVLDRMGMNLLFWRVKQRPGKPLAAGVLGHRLVFGLPGNPVSSSVCFEQYVRPALARMSGRHEVVPDLIPALLDEPVRKPSGLYFFLRGILTCGASAELRVRATGTQSSNLYSSVVQANCLIHLPEEMEDPGGGTLVDVEPLPWTFLQPGRNLFASSAR